MALRTILDRFEKAQLQDIGDILGSDLPSRLRKSQMLDKLCGYIKEEPGRWLSYLMERDIHLLKDLVHAGPEKVRYMDFADYPSIVELSGIVEYDDSDENYHKVWISREIYEIVSPEIDSVLKRMERSGQYQFERIGLGYLNLYGILSTEDFLDEVFSWYQDHRGTDFRSLEEMISRSPLVKLARYENQWGDNLVSPSIDDVDLMFTMRSEHKRHRGRKHFSLADVMEAGGGAPYFIVGMNTPEGKALEKVYRALGYSGFALVKAEHDTWLEAQYTDNPNPVLFDPLYDAPLAREVSQSVWENYCMVVCDYADSVPKWCLRGRSAKETGESLCDRDAWRIPGEFDPNESPKSAPGEDYPRWSMPEPTVSDGFGILDSDFPIGFSIPHVAADDPCPCGSGLRYSRCHGKYLS
ncbi:MAG: SEC-C domain-containing protein [Bacteroidales bacterium]|nr:SEC-C domain-containing protein [Bacteroidales bacterium]